MEKNEIKFARIYESVHHMNHFNWNLSRDCCWGAHEVQQKKRNERIGLWKEISYYLLWGVAI